MIPQDHNTLDDFVRELTNHQGDLLFYIRALCGNADAAADIRQTVNMILWRKRDQFRAGSNFKAWSFQVARLEVKTYSRNAEKGSSFDDDPDFLKALAEESTEHINDLPERRTALAECLKGLTPKDDELIRHHYWSNGTLDALADATGRSTGTLKARLFQLRASLRRCIDRRLITTQS